MYNAHNKHNEITILNFLMKNQKTISVIFILVCIVVVYIIFFGFPKGSSETEDNYIFKDVSGVLTIDNPYGIIRIFPSKNDKLYFQVNKFANFIHPFKKFDGIPEVEAVFKQNGHDLDIKLKYKYKGGRKLWTDLFLFCPKVEKIRITSKMGNVWVENIPTNLELTGEGKSQEITIIKLAGDLKVNGKSGHITIKMLDHHKLFLNSGSAIARVIFDGKFPGPTKITGDGGQHNIHIALDANGKIISTTKGQFFSNLTPPQWKLGKIKSDGKPMTTTLGEEGSTIVVEQTNGEIIFDHQIPIEAPRVIPVIPFDDNQATTP